MPVSDECPGYPEGEDGEVALEGALAEARATGRRILALLGNNQCLNCRAFCELWRRPQIVAAAEKGFVVFKIDISDETRFRKIRSRLRLSGEVATPYLVVLDANEKIMTSQDGYPFLRGIEEISYVPELVVDFLHAWTGPPAPPPAK